ncbi:MAG: GIY-YIG nuclease family protein [Paludibacteraceae bacterium]|nr:GIY-YIG nuclease family protein [Paludibacteraceae bacterium]MCQ2344660.1 GIY-YIG nuclease family protein [Paludibacteraceae bacterium]
MKEDKTGFVYILTNPSFREDWVKIGKSSRPVDVRSKELDNTAVPLPFEIYATLQTEKYNEVERLVHKTIDRLTDLRIRQNREFFNIDPQTAFDILVDISTTLTDAVIMLKGEQYDISKRTLVNPQKEEKSQIPQRPPFKFSMIGLNIGDEIVFEPTKIVVSIATDNKVSYKGRLYSLSAFTGTFLPEDQQNSSGAYQGPKYFSYKGEILNDLRRKFEAEEQC